MMRDQEIRSKIETRRDAKDLESKLDARIEQLRFRLKSQKVKLPYFCDASKDEDPVLQSAVPEVSSNR